MYTDEQLRALIASDKTILASDPADGYREVDGQLRRDLTLTSSLARHPHYSVFIRRNTTFIENFSIGLRYKTGDPSLKIITLVRYNGAHGETSRDPDGHLAVPHIHRLTQEELASGSSEPQERRRDTSVSYKTFEEALHQFMVDTCIANPDQSFPELRQRRLFG